MRGRKPKPTALKIVAGNPGKRPLNPYEPKPEGNLVNAPEWLSAEQREIWDEALASCPQGLLKQLDQSVFLTWVCAYAIYQESAKKQAQTGVLIKSPSQGIPMQSPYLPVMNRQAQIMLKAAAEMGFTPASRARVVVLDSTSNGDPWGDVAG